MPLPPVSTPFDYLITQIETDLIHAAELCRDIRQNRRIGSEHKQLDALEASLSEGPSYIHRERRNNIDVRGANVDGGDDVVRTDLTSYVREVEEINSRLESIAYPPTNHYHHRHPSFFFPPWDQHHHWDKEVPHFHEIRQKWENVRDGIGHTFAQFRYRRELDEERKAKEKKDEGKIKDDKKEAKEKAKEKLRKEKGSSKKTADELKKKLAEKEKEDADRLAEKEKLEQSKLEHIEEIARRRDANVEEAIRKKLEEDPIEQARRVAAVVNEFHHPIAPSPQVFYLASPRSPSASSYRLSTHHTPHHDSVVFNNVIESGVPPGDIEEIINYGDHVGAWTGPSNGYAHRHPRPVQITGPNQRRSLTHSAYRPEPMPARYGDVDGFWYPRDTAWPGGW